MTDIMQTGTVTAAAPGITPRPVLEIDDLSVSFSGRSGKHLALKGISFTLNKGEIVAVVGESEKSDWRLHSGGWFAGFRSGAI